MDAIILAFAKRANGMAKRVTSATMSTENYTNISIVRITRKEMQKIDAQESSVAGMGSARKHWTSREACHALVRLQTQIFSEIITM